MDVNELKKVKNFYETVICQGIIKPIEMNEIYSLVFPQEKDVNLIPMMLKQRRITAFMQNKYAEVLNMFDDLFIDKPQTGSAPIYDKTMQSHSEDESDNHKLLAKYEYELEKELDANARRSLKQKIYHIKKRIANETI